MKKNNIWKLTKYIKNIYYKKDLKISILLVKNSVNYQWWRLKIGNLNHQKKVLGDTNVLWNFISSERNYALLKIPFVECAKTKAIGLHPCLPRVDFCYGGISKKPHCIFENHNWIQRCMIDPAANINCMLIMIVRVNVVLNRTVVVDSDWRFDNLQVL